MRDRAQRLLYLKEFVYLFDGLRQGEDSHPVVILYARIAHRDKRITPPDHAGNNGIGGEIKVFDGLFGNGAARSYGIFDNLSVAARHIFNKAGLAGKGELENLAGRNELFVDDGIYAEFLGETEVFYILDLGYHTFNAEFLGGDAGQDIGLIAAADSREGVVRTYALLCRN